MSFSRKGFGGTLLFLQEKQGSPGLNGQIPNGTQTYIFLTMFSTALTQAC